MDNEFNSVNAKDFPNKKAGKIFCKSEKTYYTHYNVQSFPNVLISMFGKEVWRINYSLNERRSF